MSSSLVTRGLGGLRPLIVGNGLGNFLSTPDDGDNFRIGGQGVYQFFKFESIMTPTEWVIRQKTNP